MKKPKKLLITGALSLLLLAETVMAAPAVAMGATKQTSSTRIPLKTYNSPRATEEPDLAFPSAKTPSKAPKNWEPSPSKHPG